MKKTDKIKLLKDLNSGKLSKDEFLSQITQKEHYVFEFLYDKIMNKEKAYNDDEFNEFLSQNRNSEIIIFCNSEIEKVFPISFENGCKMQNVLFFIEDKHY